MTTESVVHVVPRAHAVLSASSAYRWTVCTKSARLEEQYKDSSSAAAREGTLAHALAEYSLIQGVSTEDVDFAALPGFLEEAADINLNEDDLQSMRRHVQEYVDYVMALPGVRYFEQRVDFSHLVPDGFGTSDAIVLQGNVADVVDLKYGKGKKVFADGPQTKLYALGALHDYDFIFDQVEFVRLHIHQPRLDHVDVYEMPIAELRAFGDWIKARAELAYNGTGEFVAGDHCDFCRARKDCRARAQANLDMATKEFGMECPPADRLSIEEIAAILPRLDQFIKWAKELDEHALELALEGTRIPGYKVVEGRSTRKWTDELNVAAAMRKEGLSNEQIYKMSLIGITEAEKLLGKKSEVFGLAVKAEGKPTLVPLSDKRPELAAASVESDFAEPVTQ